MMLNKLLLALTNLNMFSLSPAKQGQEGKDYRIGYRGMMPLTSTTSLCTSYKMLTFTDVNKVLCSIARWTLVNICCVLTFVMLCKELLLLTIVKAPRAMDTHARWTVMYTLRHPSPTELFLKAGVELLYKSIKSINLMLEAMSEITSDQLILYVHNMYHPTGVADVAVGTTVGEGL